MGRATALLLAKQGCQVAACDINGEAARATAELCRAAGVKASSAAVDVASRTAVEGWAAQTEQEHGAVHILINNAGVALGATVEDTSYEDFEWLMNINFWGVVHGTKAFLPYLRKNGEGHIVNISSVFGLIGVPTQSAYNAAKFAVRGFTESLRQELQTDDSGIGVTSVHPGGIQTNIAKAARMRVRSGWVDEQSVAEFEQALVTTPDRAAEHILHAIVKNRARQLIGKDAVAIDLLQRLLPTLYQSLLVRFARIRRKKLLARATVG